MIALGEKCLLFQTASGESVPLSPEMISIELSGGAEEMFEPDFVDNAASAVFHYFKYEMGRETVTVAEFAEALEKALKSFGGTGSPPVRRQGRFVVESDLRKLVTECGPGCELVFFPRLRTELRELMKGGARTVQFSGLRDCVKALTGARRWNLQCRKVEAQILSYLRSCFSAEHSSDPLSLVIR